MYKSAPFISVCLKQVFLLNVLLKFVICCILSLCIITTCVKKRYFTPGIGRYPVETCLVCRQRLFPEDPSKAIHNERAAAHVERIYCGHAYHHDCLILYLKTPPFDGGKKCLGCGKRIYHEKWKVTPELAEAR